MSNSLCSQCGGYIGSGAMGTTLHQCLCHQIIGAQGAAQQQATPDKIRSLEQELKLAKEKLTETTELLIKARSEVRILGEALELECSCLGAANWVGGEVLCDCCEALKKVGWVKK